ncbi:ATP-binding protein [Fusobacterium polymorphum]|jgi:hypothetical protein|uniref:HD-CE domain-containing protein n=1 Tax=Fusobacterium nucleatum subsp. polymorphum TaxID=76857 RepID=A0A2C6CN66_FUSNP|nr:ATP-binding protein [Fusobacterium polymorphum]PHI17522.1 hypothetical protein CBG56_00630 [Fusobacterium polymorphum]
MNYFEKILDEKTKQENTIDYFTQWNYDKEIYLDVLAGVRDYYPNYTDHSNKHSEAILTNILRMFGEDGILKLSSFDLWLLLESVYLHDCGMYITREEAIKVLNDDNFKQFFYNISQDPRNPMYKYTKFFGDKYEYSDTIYHPNHDYSMRFIISSYKRSKHSEDFQKVIEWKDKLLPDRMYKILGNIAKAHGEKFSDVLKLPKKENGLGNELGHPIFIASLLRIGDLLDIDNNRFSKMLIKNIESILPVDSSWHIDKHKSIEHFWIDEEKIEITAKINSGKKNYDIADITGNWFSYIEEEYNNLLHNWKRIIPKNFNKTLPTLGELKIEMVDYEYITSKKKPKFSLDINNTLSLLMGTSIYDKKEKAFQEIIQNSIDAIYLRVFEENKNQYNFNKKLKLEEIIDLFKDKKILVEINKNTNKSENDDIYNYWNISIKDKGLGIDKEHIKYIIEAGSSYKDDKKKKIIDSMPSWLKPSGNFGIGFQSIFMLTDCVKLRSKSLYSHENIEIELLKPSIFNYDAGNIYYKKTFFDYKQEIGTEISFEYKTLKVTKRVTIKDTLGNEKNFLKDYISKYDALLDNNFDIGIYEVLDTLNKINMFSLIDIIVKKENEEIILDKKLNIKSYSPKEKFQISLFPDNENLFSDYYYKNQKVSNGMIIQFFPIIINIVGFKANEVLEINREKIKSNFKEEHTIELIEAIYKFIAEELNFQDLEENIKVQISCFYFYYKNYLKENKYKKEEVEKFFYDYKSNDFFFQSINELLELDEFSIKINLFNSVSFYYTLNNERITEGILGIFLSEIFKKNHYNVKCEEDGFLFKKIAKLEEEIIDIDYDYSKLFSEFRYPGNRGRFFIYSNKLTKNLRLKEYNKLELEHSKTWIKFNNGRENMNIFFPLIERNFILFPFFVKSYNELIWNDTIKEKYIEFSYKNRLNEKLNREDIEKETDKFIENIEKEIQKIGNIKILKK